MKYEEIFVCLFCLHSTERRGRNTSNMAAGGKRNELWSYSQKPLFLILKENISYIAFLRHIATPLRMNYEELIISTTI